MWSNVFPKACTVVAEVAQNHDGSLGAAHAYIDAVANAGASAIKFQTHIAEAESSPAEPWRVKFSHQDETRYDYWKRIGFSDEQWRSLAEHAAMRGLVFLSSPFSLKAVDLLERIGMKAWKIGAGEVTNTPMLQRVARTRQPVILSSGVSGWQDLDRAFEILSRDGAPVAVLQCTTAYPCPPEAIGLNVMDEIRTRYNCRTGISDHSGTIYAGLAAAALGADLIEVHVTFSRECFGPDVSASVTTSELADLIKGVHFIQTARQNPVKKELMAEKLAEMRMIFGKSIVAARNIPAGTVIAEADIDYRKPGTGMPAARSHDVVNHRLKRAVSAGSFLMEQDIEF